MKKVELQNQQGQLLQPQNNHNLEASSVSTSQTPFLETKEVFIGKARMSQQQIDQLQQQKIQIIQQQANFQQMQSEHQKLMESQQMLFPSTQNQQQKQTNQPQLITTQGEEQRKIRRAEERQKYQRFIPEEDPRNLIIQSGYQSTLHTLGECSGTLGQYCCCPNPNVQVNNSFKGIFERFGKYVKTVDAGLHFVNPCTDTLIQIDCKTQNLDLGMQSSITQDNIVLLIHGVVQYRIINCRQAHYSVESIFQSVKELSICALRSTISSMKYQSILDDREVFRKRVEQFVDEYIQDWGVDVEQVIIKDMSMDKKTQDNLAKAAMELRFATAKILRAKANVAAAEEQKKAVEQLASKAAMQIRFLNTLERVGLKSKVVFLSD